MVAAQTQGQAVPAVDPVQSIRVASTLVERFRVILHTTKDPTLSDLELLIGETQQLYPEIWRHLDDAGRALRAQGRDVDQFDELRRHELGHLGVTDVDVTTQVDYLALLRGHYGEKQVKTASFNLAGYHRARRACDVLMAAMPEIDWAAIVAEEDRQIAAAGSLHARRWRSLAIAIVLGAAVLAAAALVYRFATSVDPDPAPSAKPVRDPEAEMAALREHVEQRNARIAELYAVYEATCDRAPVPELASLLRDAMKDQEARELETKPCVPARPSCEDVRAAIADRVGTQLGLEHDDEWQLTCVGVVTGAPGALAPGLAVVVTGRGHGAAARTFRGVTSADGARDLVPFAAAPVPTVVGIVDLDGDATDELVMVGPTTLVVTRIRADGFADVPGPDLRAGCSATVNVEGDFRGGKKGERKAIVITATDPTPKKGCLASGRHYYELHGDGVVETE